MSQSKSVVFNAEFVAMLSELDLKFDKNNLLRNKKGQFVKMATVFEKLDSLKNYTPEDVMINNDSDKPEMTYTENPTGIEEVEENMLEKKLPDWETMSWEQILPYVVYAKKEVRAGVQFRTPIKDEEGNIIPVSNAGDGGEYTKWSEADKSDDPETVALNRTARAEELLVSWGYEIGEYSIRDQGKLILGHGLRRDVEVLKTAICIGNAHPFMDAEDLLEVIKARQEEKEEKARINIRAWIIQLFKGQKEIQKRVLKMIRNEIDTAKQMGAELEFEDRSTIIQHCSWGAWVDESGKWSTQSNLPSIPRVIENMVNGRLTSETKRLINQYVSQTCWNEWRKEMSDALKGTIVRWVGNELAIETIRVKAEDNHVDRDAVNLFKTDLSEVFKKGKEDYMWDNRMDDNSHVRRNGKWIETAVLAYAFKIEGKHPFLK